MIAECRKWLQTFVISWSNHMAYKFNFVLLMVAPTVVFFLVKYNLWSSIYSFQEQSSISVYTLPQMLEYQGWVLIVMLLAQGHMNTEIAMDIRLGRISSYLLYPFSFIRFHFANFLSFQSIQLVASTIALGFLVASQIIPSPELSSIILGVLFSLLTGILWFHFQYLFGIFAFWLEETWVLRAMFINITHFLSGSIIPLELYPSWLTESLWLTPFPSMTFVPTKIFMGAFDGNLLGAFLIPLVWILILQIVIRSVWKRGIRMYTAAGI